MESTEQHPELSAMVDFMVECVDFAGHYVSAAASMSSQLSQPSDHSLNPQSSHISVASNYAVSDDERAWYYSGIADEGEHPNLLYRTGSTKYPWVRPIGRHAHPPAKSLRGVHATPLNKVWATVGPQVCELVKERVKSRFTVDPARFLTRLDEGDDEENGFLGPVTIWVGVYPGSTAVDTAHEVSQKVLEVLRQNGIEDVEVEWHEGVVWSAAGPPLLRVVDNDDATAHVRRHLTAALGMPIAVGDIDRAQGSVGFFFHEGRDEHGNPSTRVYGVSNRHVLHKSLRGTYDFRGGCAPRKHVFVNGSHRFQRGLNEIKVAVAGHVTLVDLYTRTLDELQAKDVLEDEEEVKADAERLRKTRDKLDEHKRAIVDLHQFYKDVLLHWGDAEHRKIGYAAYSPPLAVDVTGPSYTEDWGTFILDEAKFKAHFKGNVVNLGTAMAPETLTARMHPRHDARNSFKYPTNRLLRINGVVTPDTLAQYGQPEAEDEPSLIVLKDGSGSDLTVGRYAGIHSYRADDRGIVSSELAFYAYDRKAGAFSARGDSGALIFDGLGRMVGLLHSSQSKNSFTNAYTTYATPASWLLDRIKAKYPHADFTRTAW